MKHSLTLTASLLLACPLLAEDEGDALDPMRAFALGADQPLLRLHITREKDREWRVRWCFHHIVLDGWSCGLLVKELLADYAARRAGNSAIHAEAVPYRRFID